jgi:hypothetical protein
LRRGLARTLAGIGYVLIYGGWVLAALAAITCVIVGIKNLAAGGSPKNAALIFPGAPIAAGVINVVVSGPGRLYLAWANRLALRPPPGAEKLDKITRRALATDPEVRELWEDEL